MLIKDVNRMTFVGFFRQIFFTFIQRKNMIMKSFYKLLSLSFLVPLAMASCKKNKLPADPFAGLNNQLVCKVNGSEWRSNENTYSGFYDLNPYTNLKYLYLTYRKSNQVIQLFINSPYQSGKLILNQNTSIYPNISNPKNYAAFINEYSNFTPEDVYVTNSTDTGVADFIILDSINKKIKATLTFTGKDSRTGRKITITDCYLEYHQ